MRDTSSLDPTWADSLQSGRAAALTRWGLRVTGAVVRQTSPALLRWLQGHKPQARFAWGPHELHLQRDGWRILRRDAPGWEDNPRRNHNEAVARRQERERARQNDEETIETETPKISLSHEELQKAAALKMGITAPGGDGSAGEVPREPEALGAELSRLRDFLQQLDDVKDYDLVEAIDEELYLLHKAVEYKLRNHKASEAKSQLHSLFK